MKSLSKRKKKGIEEDLTLRRYSFDIDLIDEDDFYANLLPKSKRLTEFIKSNNEKEIPHPYLKNLILDLFSAYNRHYVKFLNKNEVYSDYLLNYFTVKELTSLPDFKQVRELTRKDELTSLLAVESILEPLVKIIEELKEANEDLKDFLKEVKEGLKSQDLKMPPKTEEDFKEALKKNIEPKLREDLETSALELMQRIDTINEFGLGSDGSFSRMSYEEKLKTLDELKNNSKVKEVSLLAGKLKAIYKKGRRSWTREGMDSIRGTTKGSDLSSTLTYDLSYMANSSYKKLFYKKVLDSDLSNYSYGSKKTKGQGPIVVLIDTSGSMGGDRDTYAKATFMALLEVCRKQKREMVVILFDSGRYADELHTVSFNKSELNSPKKLIDVITFFGGGGTLFEPPLSRARKEISKSKVFKKSDIIFITDGHSRLSDSFVRDFNSWKKESKTKVYSILIGEGAKSVVLTPVSDSIDRISDLEKDKEKASKELFRFLDLKNKEDDK